LVGIHCKKKKNIERKLLGRGEDLKNFKI
jgi:hypothetical protein